MALLQRLHIGRAVSVLTTVLVSIAVAGGISWVIANQLVDVANQLPRYRQNIHARIDAFHLPVTGQLSQAAQSVQEIVDELTGPSEPSPALASPARKQNKPNAPAALSPLPVRVVQPSVGRMEGTPRSGHASSCAVGSGREWSSSLRSSCC